MTQRAELFIGEVLVSEKETTPMAQISETIEILSPITECCGKNVVVFTDGSRGKRTKDK